MALVTPVARVPRDVRLLLALLAVALVPRLPTLAQPLLEKHPFRQTWTAYTARLYHEGGIDLLHPELPVFGPPFFHPQEFPLFQAIAALGRDAGIATDLAMRLTALAFFFATALMLFGLVRRVAGSRAAWLAVVFFVASPFALVWSRASLIEYLATAGTIGYLWAGIRYRDERRWRDFGIALAAGAIGILVKPTTGVFCAIPLALYQTPASRAGVREWFAERLDARLIVLGVGPAALAVWWTAMADAFFRSKPAAAFLAPSALRDYFLDLSVGRGDLDLWGLIASRFAFWVVGVPFVPLLVLGLVIGWRTRARWLWVGLALAAVLPVLVFYGGYRRHDYYQVAISPEVAAFLGLGAAWLVDRALRYRRWAAPATGAVGLALLAYVYASTADYWRPIYDPVFDGERVLPAARELSALTRADDLVVMVGRGFDPDVLYYARRKGLLISAENGTAALYRTLPAQDYRVFFSWDPAHDAIDILRWWAWNGVVAPHTYTIGRGPGDLRAAPILATDDTALYEQRARAARSLLAAPLRIPCDLVSHAIPAAPEGTWLRIRPDPAARIWATPLLAPLAVRSVVILAPQVTLGQQAGAVYCVGANEIVIEGAFAGPPPG
jgi:hypothetical protein